MHNFIKLLLLLISSSLFIACSDESNNSNAGSKSDHVWKEQTDTINKAREIEGIIMDSAEETRKALEQQSE